VNVLTFISKAVMALSGLGKKTILATVSLLGVVLSLLGVTLMLSNP